MIKKILLTTIISVSLLALWYFYIEMKWIEEVNHHFKGDIPRTIAVSFLPFAVIISVGAFFASFFQGNAKMITYVALPTVVCALGLLYGAVLFGENLFTHCLPIHGKQFI